MIRTFLGVGDRAGDAVIIEGLPSVTCSNPPPCVNISTVYMKTWCNACKKEGFIAPRGPRRPGTGPNGKEWALSGDINVCDCSPPPLFHAERNMTMSFTAEEVAKLMGQSSTGSSSVGNTVPAYDEQVRVVADRVSIAGYPYYIETASGDVYCGRVESDGLLPRIAADEAEPYTIYWGDEALLHEDRK
jgi:hypothetical protein